MQFYLILLAILYLIVSFISIFKMEVVFTRIFENYYGCVVIVRLSINDDEFSKRELVGIYRLTTLSRQCRSDRI